MKNNLQLPNDDFDRDNVASKLANLLISDIDVSPLLLNGGWGSGKTTLVKRLEIHLEKKQDKLSYVYINSFQEDHCENSLITLISALAKIIPDTEKPQLLARAIPVIKYSLKTVSKAAASYIIKRNINEISDEVKDIIKDVSGKAIDYSIESILKENIDSEKNISNLKSILETLSKDKTLVIIIDELDRCKPSFAIDIVENIKYIFEMKNIKFLLVANSKQLESSISHKYGQPEPSKGYLDKFVKYTLDIPSCFGKDNTLKNSSTHFFYKEISNKTDLNFKENFNILEKIGDLIVMNNISLREIETYIRTIQVYNEFSQEKISNQNNILIKTVKLVAIFIYCFGYKLEVSLEDIFSDGKNIEKIPGLNIEKESRYYDLSRIIAILLAHCNYDKSSENYICNINSKLPEEYVRKKIEIAKKISSEHYFEMPDLVRMIYNVYLTLSLS